MRRTQGCRDSRLLQRRLRLGLEQAEPVMRVLLFVARTTFDILAVKKKTKFNGMRVLLSFPVICAPATYLRFCHFAGSTRQMLELAAFESLKISRPRWN